MRRESKHLGNELQSRTEVPEFSNTHLRKMWNLGSPNILGLKQNAGDAFARNEGGLGVGRRDLSALPPTSPFAFPELDEQTDRQPNRQTDRQTDRRQTDKSSKKGRTGPLTSLWRGLGSARGERMRTRTGRDCASDCPLPASLNLTSVLRLVMKALSLSISPTPPSPPATSRFADLESG